MLKLIARNINQRDAAWQHLLDTRANRQSKEETMLVKCACKLSHGNQIAGLPDRLKSRFLSGLLQDQLNSVLSMAKHRQFCASSVIINQEDLAE
jgi:hypothetical protein